MSPAGALLGVDARELIRALTRSCLGVERSDRIDDRERAMITSIPERAAMHA